MLAMGYDTLMVNLACKLALIIRIAMAERATLLMILSLDS